MFIKRGDTRIDAGQFDAPVAFYTVPTTQGTAGEVSYSAADAVFSYNAWANVDPYQASELQDARKVIGEIWAVISIRYSRSRVPVEGMFCKVKLTGDMYEVRGVAHVETGRKKVELTCRLVR